MPLRPQACCRSALRSRRSEAVWITDERLSDVFHRFCQGSQTLRRHGSSVPGPMEHRRRLGNRRLSVAYHDAPTKQWLDVDTIRQWWRSGERKEDWHWQPPRNPDRHSQKFILTLPRWMKGHEQAQHVDDGIMADTSKHAAEPQATRAAKCNRVDQPYMTELQDAMQCRSVVFVEARDKLVRILERHIIAGVCCEPSIVWAIDNIPRALERSDLYQDHHQTTQLNLDTSVLVLQAIWRGISQCKVLTRSHIKDALYEPLLRALYRLDMTDKSQVLFTDIVVSLGIHGSPWFGRMVAQALNTWTTRWSTTYAGLVDVLERHDGGDLGTNRKGCHHKQFSMHSSIAARFFDKSRSDEGELAAHTDSLQALCNSALRLSSIIRLLQPSNVDAFDISEQFTLLMQMSNSKSENTHEKHRSSVWSCLWALSTLPKMNTDALISFAATLWEHADATMPTADRGPVQVRLCQLLSSSWLAVSDTRAVKEPPLIFAEYDKISSNRSTNAYPLVRLVDTLLSAKVRDHQRIHHVLCVVQVMSPDVVLEIVTGPLRRTALRADVIRKKIQSMTGHDVAGAMSLFQAYRGWQSSQNDPHMLEVEHIPGFIQAAITNPAIKPSRVWRLLGEDARRLDTHRTLFSVSNSSPLPQTRIHTIETMANEFAHKYPRSQATRNILRCALYLRKHNIRPTRELSRALCHVGVVRAFAHSDTVGWSKLRFMLGVVRRQEGVGVAQALDMAVHDLMERKAHRR